MVCFVPRPLQLAEERLERLLGLSPDQARRAVTEVVDCLWRSVDEYVADRHRELQGQGTRNAQIYQTLSVEVEALRFAAPKLSPRQLRRRIYG
jgi:hypothetical protein